MWCGFFFFFLHGFGFGFVVCFLFSFFFFSFFFLFWFAKRNVIGGVCGWVGIPEGTPCPPCQQHLQCKQ